MEVLSEFPLEFGFDEALNNVRVSPTTAKRIRVRELLEKAVGLVHPKAVYSMERITQRNGDILTVGESKFRSHVLARNLRSTDTVFLFIATIGEALENRSHIERNAVTQLVLEDFGNFAIGSLINRLERHVSEKHGLGIVSRMSPGQLDWPLDQQRQLFSLFDDVQSAIGVKLTDSLLMMPRKSVSGIIFPTKVPFISCQLCERQACSSRRAEYDEALSREYFSDQAEDC